MVLKGFRAWRFGWLEAGDGFWGCLGVGAVDIVVLAGEEVVAGGLGQVVFDFLVEEVELLESFVFFGVVFGEGGFGYFVQEAVFVVGVEC